MRVTTYECPEGCKATNGQPIAATVRGWKMHMTRSHGGWTEDQLKALVDVGAGTPSSGGKEAFLREGEESEKLAEAPIEGAPKSTPEQEAQKVVALKTDAMGKKFNAKLNKMKSKIAEALPKALSKAVEEKGPEWALNDDDTALLAESVENCFDVLDIDFKITPFSTVLSNPLWVLILPLLACVLVFAPKAIAAQKAKQESETP